MLLCSSNLQILQLPGSNSNWKTKTTILTTKLYILTWTHIRQQEIKFQISAQCWFDCFSHFERINTVDQKNYTKCIAQFYDFMKYAYLKNRLERFLPPSVFWFQNGLADFSTAERVEQLEHSPWDVQNIELLVYTPYIHALKSNKWHCVLHASVYVHRVYVCLSLIRQHWYWLYFCRDWIECAL